jgi:predicted Zn-dependent peptidase
VVDLVCREITRISKHGIERKELDRAKNQMKGSLMLSLESSHSRMSKLAKDELIYGRRTSLEEMLTHIDRVTVDQVSTVGRELFGMTHLAITGLGPLSARALHAYR